MPTNVVSIELLIFFAGWLVLALMGGALIVFVWELLRARHIAAKEGTSIRPSSMQ